MVAYLPSWLAVGKQKIEVLCIFMVNVDCPDDCGYICENPGNQTATTWIFVQKQTIEQTFAQYWSQVEW